jgi:hypothetical protein
MRLLQLVRNHKLASLWFVFLAITFLASIFVVNPTLRPESSLGVFRYPQLELQFAYTPERGMAVLESWGAGSTDRYLSVIWIDILFALSYGPFFFMLLRRLGAGLVAMVVPLVEMVTNLIETSLEIYWVTHHTVLEPLFATFLTHSVIATLKWALVPVYLVHSLVLIYRALRRPAAQPLVAGEQPEQA